MRETWRKRRGVKESNIPKQINQNLCAWSLSINIAPWWFGWVVKVENPVVKVGILLKICPLNKWNIAVFRIWLSWFDYRLQNWDVTNVVPRVGILKGDWASLMLGLLSLLLCENTGKGHNSPSLSRMQQPGAILEARVLTRQMNLLAPWSWTY